MYKQQQQELQTLYKIFNETTVRQKCEYVKCERIYAMNGQEPMVVKTHVYVRFATDQALNALRKTATACGIYRFTVSNVDDRTDAEVIEE